MMNCEIPVVFKNAALTYVPILLCMAISHDKGKPERIWAQQTKFHPIQMVRKESFFIGEWASEFSERRKRKLPGYQLLSLMSPLMDNHRAQQEKLIIF